MICWDYLLKSAVEMTCWNQLLKLPAEINCWDYLLRSVVEISCWHRHCLLISISCWNYMLRPTVEIIWWGLLLRSSVVINCWDICWIYLLRSAVEILCSIAAIICLDQLLRLSAETNCCDSMSRFAQMPACVRNQYKNDEHSFKIYKKNKKTTHITTNGGLSAKPIEKPYT